MRDLFQGGLALVIGLVWTFAGPITYVLLILETWHSEASGFVKICISITLDPILAAIWPVTWGYWIWENSQGYWTPLRLL